MVKTHSTNRKRENADKILVGKSEGKRSLGGRRGMECIKLACVRQRSIVKVKRAKTT
jgi:hypothetical protein